MSQDEKFLLIRNYDLWCHLSDEEYEELDIAHHFIEAKKGEYIYFDSHHLNKLYFVKDGYIKIGYIDETGNEIIKEIIKEGEIFGQFSLERNNLNGEFAKAYKRDVSLCSFSIEDFEQLLKKRPDLAIKYSKQVGEKLRR
ncbi:MAG TPA: Crp/Fnr family transcriptional regulator, partial [Chitinophagaceae bacterium]|nr:Crp/Fnr family transcriptional regulator [Chitinophagaceae bacterium]